MRKSERGIAILWLLGMVVVASTIVVVAANHWSRASDRVRDSIRRESDHVRARGGIRFGVQKLVGDPGFRGTLEEHELRVTIGDTGIRAESGTAVITVRWISDGGIRITEWNEH